MSLYNDVKAADRPQLVEGLPDYSATAMEATAAKLPQFKQRLSAIGYLTHVRFMTYTMAPSVGDE